MPKKEEKDQKEVAKTEEKVERQEYKISKALNGWKAAPKPKKAFLKLNTECFKI